MGRTVRDGLAYTGIGSRRTPHDVCRLCVRLGVRLASRGWHLRSGGAEGADASFEEGASQPDRMTIFRPWKRAGEPAHYVAPAREVLEKAAEIAASIHPAWGRLSPAARKLHTRNVLQVLGANLDDPSRFVVCWTPDGSQSESETSSATGGTRTAIVLAHRRGVPVFNLQRTDSMERLGALVRDLGGVAPGDAGAA